MIFTLDFSIPKNTPLSAPIHDVMLVSRGLIYRVEFQFPAGCAGLAYMMMADGGHQVYPSSLGEFFHTDNFTIAFDDLYLKLVSPYQFDFYGYNLDETYDHVIYCRVGMADKDEYMARFLPNLGYEQLIKLQAEETAKQEEASVAVLKSPFPWLKGRKVG